jgi:sarcosine oxidase
VWEERFGRRLVGEEGLLISGEDIVPAWEGAMADAAAPHRLLSAKECGELFPLVRPPVGPVLFDPHGGATRARRTVELLAGEIGDRLRLATVLTIESTGTGCVVYTADATWTCDEVVIAAGLDSGELARQVDLEVPATPIAIARFTFPVRSAYRHTPLRCWIDDSKALGENCHAYGQPVGTTGRYALGVSWKNRTVGVMSDATAAESLRLAQQYVAEVLPGLDPKPVDEVRCTYPEYPSREDNDGFWARRRDHITVIYGDNLFKFAPLLGALLRDTVINGTLPSELTLLADEQSATLPI